MDVLTRYQGGLGVVAILAAVWLLSENRRAISLRTVLGGLTLQSTRSQRRLTVSNVYVSLSAHVALDTPPNSSSDDVPGNTHIALSQRGVGASPLYSICVRLGSPSSSMTTCHSSCVLRLSRSPPNSHAVSV